MLSTFRNPTILCACTLVVLLIVATQLTGGKSIIRELLEPRQFVPDGRGSLQRPGRHNVPIEECRVKEQKDLSGRLDRLCDDCFSTYRVSNFYMQCRESCFDNSIFRGCALALYRQELVREFDKFLETEVSAKGMTLPPKADKGDSAAERQLIRDV